LLGQGSLVRSAHSAPVSAGVRRTAQIPTKQSDETFDHLHRLIKKGNRVRVRAWTAAGSDANLRNKHGWSLLMLAALHGRTDIVEVLLAAGADANLENTFGDMAAGLARLKGFDRTAEALERAMVGDGV